jgi:hypothetical protein
MAKFIAVFALALAPLFVFAHEAAQTDAAATTETTEAEAEKKAE